MSSMHLGVLLLALVAYAKTPAGTAVELPEGSPGIGFDDLRYSSSFHRVLVPSGRTGRLNLVNPDTLAVTSIAGFSAKTTALRFQRSARAAMSARPAWGTTFAWAP